MLGRPERPISSAEQDTLGREGFVRRLVSAVVNGRTGKSTGVVVGITGPWGSGKSSILNMVQERLRREYSEAVVVRFDPWLVSGRNDLISEFVSELLGELSKDADSTKKLKAVADTLTKYGEHLAPTADLVLPGLGLLFGGGIGAIRKKFFTEESLNALREKLATELNKASVPIVVLIDEIDRVDDHEIRTVAQLVRAVADFSGISYILAYDADRVAQALGSDAPEAERVERGRAYLEKIVQLQIPLPLTFDDEVAKLLLNELQKLSDDLQLPENFGQIERFKEFLGIVAGNAISTPRDVSRLVGTYHVLRAMLIGEVDFVDLVAYATLMVKAPKTVDAIRRDPGAFIGQTLSIRGAELQMERPKTTVEERLAQLLPASERTWEIRSLVQFLFPRLREFGATVATHSDALAERRPLLTTLRLGLLPGSYTRSQMQHFVEAPEDEVVGTLGKALADGTIDQLIDRLEELYPEIHVSDHIRLWNSIARFAIKPDCIWMSSYQPMHEVVRELARVLERAVRRRPELFLPIANEIFHTLQNGGDNALTPYWMRTHIHAFGLFGRSGQPDRATFLNEQEAIEAANYISSSLRERHLSDLLLPCRWDLMPVYTMIDTGVWDDICRQKVDESLGDPAAVDGLTLMLFGAAYTSDRSEIAKLCTLELYLSAVDRRIAEKPVGLHETVLVALQKAKRGGL